MCARACVYLCVCLFVVQSLFESTCRFLNRRQAPHLRRSSGGEGGNAGTDRISGIALQSETNRRRTVEARVRSLLLKFRCVCVGPRLASSALNLGAPFCRWTSRIREEFAGPLEHRRVHCKRPVLPLT